MTINEAQHLILQAGLRPSPVRMLVIRSLADAPAPLSGLQIETILDTVDRSSITRTLAAFAAKGLVHTIDDGSGSIKYELCRAPHHLSEADTDRHPHFHCQLCGATFCLSGIPLPDIPLPPGFEKHSADYIVKGICPRCHT